MKRNGRKDAAEKTVRCAIYTRKSTEEGLDSDFSTLDAQRESAEAYIASQKGSGWVCLPDRFDDGGFSGGNTDRPALQRLLAEVESGNIDCVVVYKVDRLSRSIVDFGRLLETFDKHDCTFVSVTEHFTTTTPAGRMTLNLMVSFAQYEREMISERTRDKMGAARRRGKWIGGYPVLGYDRDPDGGGIVVNEDEAIQVRATFDLYLEKASLLETVKELRKLGWVNKQFVSKKRGVPRGGKPFTRATLSYLLKNVVYVGRVRFKGEVFDGEQEAIVTDETFANVQEQLRRNTLAGSSLGRNKSNALLKGILRCASCGAGMTPTYTRKGDRKYRYYQCRDTCSTGAIPAGEVERFVEEKIARIGSDQKLQREIVRQLQEQGCDDIDTSILEDFEVLWGSLTPKERVRVVQLLLERVTYDPDEETIALRFRPSGIETLAEEFVE